MTRLSKIPNLILLGNNDLPKVPIFSFIIKTRLGKLLNPYLVSSLFNDIFGIQTRSGCNCAGLYGHELLKVGPELSQKFKEAMMDGYDGLMKPGFTRFNLIYFQTEAEIDYVLWAIEFMCKFGWMFLPKYKFDADKKTWVWKEEENINRIGLD